jgi:hypothetical protein
VSEQPSDLDRLMGAAVEAATRLLSKDGEFYPFALAMTSAGEVVSPAVDPGDEHPTADAVVQLLLSQLRESRDGLRAVALCTDVRLKGDDGTERDAIRVELEAPGAEPLAVVVPYAERRLDEPFGMPAERRVFDAG